MYTEVGEQMAEQNILNGNQKKLEQIIGDVKEHNTKKDRLEKLAESVKDISKELDNARKEKQNETDSKIKASTDAICAGYDKSIEADKEKIKTVSAERDKAKMAGVKERISAETASLRAQNDDLKDQINEAFIHENISKIYNSQLFISVFNPKQLLDYVIDIAVMVGLFVAVAAAAHRWVRAVGRPGYQSCALRRRYHLWQAIRADARARGSGVSAAQLRVSIRLSAAGHLPRHADDQRVLRGHVVSGPGRAVRRHVRR